MSRSKLSRSVKAVMIIALLCYVTIVLVGMVTRMHTTRYPWKSDGADGFVGWPETRRRAGDSENNSAAIKELVLFKGLVDRTPENAVIQTEQSLKLKVEAPKTAACPKTVASLTKYSKWFRDRYKPNMKLFLDKDGVGNYSKLLSKRLPFGFKSENLTVVDEILKHQNFANPSVHGASGKQGCIRCAVVGCGGILNGSGAGEEIDSHDYIFRLNRAISLGRFAKDVGSRTTFYTFFPESQHINDVEDKNFLAFFALFKSYDVNYALSMMKQENSPKLLSRGKLYKMRKPGVAPQKLKFIHPDFFNYVFNTFLDSKAFRPTTGALVVVLALHICDEVTIYGFGYDPRFTMHYYETMFVKHTRASTGSHDVDNERKLWSKLHEEGVIRFFKRDI